MNGANNAGQDFGRTPQLEYEQDKVVRYKT